MANLNGFEIAGRAIKVNHVTEREVTTVDSLEVDESDIGMGMTPQSRAALMAKLAEGHNAGELGKRRGSENGRDRGTREKR